MVKIRYIRAAVAMAAFALVGMAAALAQPFSKMVCFGDSLSDTGNIYFASGGAFPPAPYYLGRASDGILWNEHLAGDLGVSLTLEGNYAFNGALSNYANINDGVLMFPLIGFADQIDEYFVGIAAHRPLRGNLYVVGVGSNDIFAFLAGTAPYPISAAIDNTVAAVEALVDSGTRHVVVLNISDFGLVPYFAGTGLEPSLTDLCYVYNAILELDLESLRAVKPFRLTIVDMFGALNLIVADPAAYGMTNVTVPAIEGGVDPATSLFWDGVHPTTAGHRIIADFALEALSETYSHRGREP